MIARILGIYSVIICMFLNCLTVFASESYYGRPSTSSQTQSIFSEYMDNVRFRLQKNWNPPDFQDNVHIRVVFKLDRYGKLISYNITESSGNDIYDESAIYALKKSAPFGNFPEETEREYLTINYLFETSLLNIGMTDFYYDKAKSFSRSNPQKALEYINLAIKENGENDNSYILYAERAKIKSALEDNAGSHEDSNKAKTLKNRVDIKRIHALKHRAEMENSPYIYFYLAYAYEQINDINSAINSINKAIDLEPSNYTYKRYHKNLLNVNH